MGIESWLGPQEDSFDEEFDEEDDDNA